MKKRTFYFFFADIFTQNSFAQENLSWQGFFSYTEIKDLSASTTQVLQLLKMLYSPRISQQT
jgi:hypothetical protein